MPTPTLELVIALLFGHIVGDFFFQTRNMANKKYVPGSDGTWWCTFHVLVYTMVVSLFSGIDTPEFMFAVGVPHWIIDRYSLGYRWMKLIHRADMLDSQKPIEVGFGSIIYVVIDQTMHLGCLYLLFKFL